MSGLLAFHSLAAALSAGYQVCDRTPAGYLVRTRTSRGWALAIVDLTRDPRRPGHAGMAERH